MTFGQLGTVISEKPFQDLLVVHVRSRTVLVLEAALCLRRPFAAADQRIR